MMLIKKNLKDMGYGERGEVKEIEDELREKLAGMGIRVGKELIFKTKQPIKGPVVIELEGSTTSMGIGMAEKIVVEVEE